MEFTYRTEPFEHQARNLRERAHLREDALFWEPGTGKSKAIIDQAALLYLRGEVDALVVLAPEEVHTNWVEDEIPRHMSPALDGEVRCHVYRSNRAGTKWHKEALHWVLKHRGLAVLAMTYDACRTEAGRATLWRFLRDRKCLYTCDESTRIKTPGAKTTKRVVASGAYAPYRRILTGTPVALGPFDLYSQVRFLDRDFWKRHDIPDFQTFKSHYGVWVEHQRNDDGRTFQKLVRYRRLEELREILSYVSTRVLVDDVLDLPPKRYAKRYYDLSPVQARMYTELEQEFTTWVRRTGPCTTCDGAGHLREASGHVVGCPTCGGTRVRPDMQVEAEYAIVRQLRLHQVTCGYVATEDPETEQRELTPLEGPNPRLELARRVMGEEVRGKAITWCRFRQDVDHVLGLCHDLGRDPVRYDGAVPKGERRTAARRAFQDGEATDFVGTPATGGEGLTLHAAKSMLFYSQGFNFKDRLQAEARAHRAGMSDKSLLVVDFIGRLDGKPTVDDTIAANHEMKQRASDEVTGDAA